MIKATIKSFAGNEFKTPKEVYIWIGVQHYDIETWKVIMTCHGSQEEAIANMVNKTDKALMLMLGVNPEINIKCSDIEPFSSVETLKDNIQKVVISQINNLSLEHITKLELL